MSLLRFAKDPPGAPPFNATVGASTQDYFWREGYKVERSDIYGGCEQIRRSVASKRLNKNKIVDIAEMIGSSK